MRDIEDLYSDKKPEIKHNFNYNDRMNQFMLHFLRECNSINDLNDYDKLISGLRRLYRTNLSKDEIKKWLHDNNKNISEHIMRFLVKKATRSQSGVLVVTITLSPHKFSCTEKCSYCPQETDLEGNHTQPKSYTSAEPAMLRALRYDFDIREQFWDRIKCYLGTGNISESHNQNHQIAKKMEVILSGGTWESYPIDERNRFIKECYWAANTFRDPDRKCLSLSEEQLINETAEFRIIGLTLETRPDYINRTAIKNYTKYGVTRIQIGVQHTNDKILEKLNRNCTLDDTIKAIKLLKQTGFKVVIHLMPDLPGSTPELDIQMFKRVLVDPNLQIDDIKIYPTAVTKPHNDKLILKSDISDWYNAGTYVPYAEQDIELLIIPLMYYLENIHPWNRVQRLIRDFPVTNIEVGYCKVTNLRQVIQDRIKAKGSVTRDMRTMEIRESEYTQCIPRLVVRCYDASDGLEYHISMEIYQETTEDKIRYMLFCVIQGICWYFGYMIYFGGNSGYVALVGFLRLRIDPNMGAGIISEIKNCAMIRELHVYGKQENVGNQHNMGYSSTQQHRGYGKKMMECAERIAYDSGYKHIAVIAGVGVKEYYKNKCGYEKSGTYMKKQLFDTTMHLVMIRISILLFLIVNLCKFM